MDMQPESDNRSIDVEKLFRQYGPMVLRRCRQLLKDEMEAEDMAQEVFSRLLVRQDELTGEYPSSLLWQTATNLCLNKIRDKRRHGEDTSEGLLDRIAGSHDEGSRLDARNMLDRLFGRHPASTRTIAVLHLYDGMTLEEVAKEVQLSVSGVRKRLRALKSTLVELEAV